MEEIVYNEETKDQNDEKYDFFHVFSVKSVDFCLTIGKNVDIMGYIKLCNK
jgi:hypothetical protein